MPNRRIRNGSLIVGLVALIIVVSACGPAAAEIGEQPVDKALTGVLTSPLLSASTSPVPTPSWTPNPAPAVSPTPATKEILVLHTNDNWGETEPCG